MTACRKKYSNCWRPWPNWKGVTLCGILGLFSEKFLDYQWYCNLVAKLSILKDGWDLQYCWASPQEARRPAHLWSLPGLLHWSQTASVFPCVLQTVFGATHSPRSPGVLWRCCARSVTAVSFQLLKYILTITRNKIFHFTSCFVM